MIRRFKKLWCDWFGHTWTHPTEHPTHGFHDRPVDGAQCQRCKLTHYEPRKEDWMQYGLEL